jgi:hypothetical protein
MNTSETNNRDHETARRDGPELGAAPGSATYWAFTTNVSSNRWHAYRDGHAICGSPLRPVMSEAIQEFPGVHVACKKCSQASMSPNHVI